MNQQAAFQPKTDAAEEAIATIVPFRNGKALGSYYSGCGSIVPGLGLFLGPLAIYLSVGGRKLARENPRAHGGAHAVTGLILGILGSLISFGLGALLLFMVLLKD